MMDCRMDIVGFVEVLRLWVWRGSGREVDR